MNKFLSSVVDAGFFTLEYIADHFIALMVIVIWVAVWLAPPAPFDSTDAPPKRSGFSVMTDNLTGCQYLRDGFFGSTTPRMGADGKQVCK